ncbi:plasmid replication initiator protein, partial [Mycobacteroides abscessus]|nr:plasmid replication initiator protein [Mycobacteroides abscessus]
AVELAKVIQYAIRTVTLTVNDPTADGGGQTIRFGTQIDTQPLTASVDPPPNEHNSGSSRSMSSRLVARYLAKYVTKSLAALGISARRLSTEAIPDLDVSEHVRTILTTISDLADKGLSGIGRWLHTLGFRGHITSKSRRYSTTMTVLREQRAIWTRQESSKSTAYQYDPDCDFAGGDDLVAWEFDRAGPGSLGDRSLVYSAALQRIHIRRIGLVEARRHTRSQHWDPPGASDG